MYKQVRLHGVVHEVDDYKVYGVDSRTQINWIIEFNL